jgi:hypothetical protein
MYTDNIIIHKPENPGNLRSSVSKNGNSYTIKVFSEIQAKVTFRKIASLVIKMVVPVSHKMKPLVQTYCLISKGAMFLRSGS